MEKSSLKCFISGIGLFLSLVVSAQNYSYFDPNRTRTYGIEGERYFFIEIDSVLIEGNDTTFFFKRKVDTTSFSCDVETNIIDIIGSKFKTVNDSLAYFFNKDMDTIKIFLHKGLYEPWIAYTYPDGRYITLTYTDFDYAGILPGINDSLKTIRYNVYDPLGNLLPDEDLNGWNIDVSKNFGLYEFLNFYEFPNDTANYKLRGLSNPDTATIFDVNAFHALNYLLGSEFHYREVSKPDSESTADMRISAWKYFVMEKNQSEDFVSYTMERVRFDTIYNGATPSSTIIWDTVEVIYNYSDYNFLDTIELSLLRMENYGYADWVKEDTLYMDVPHKYIYDWYEYDAVENCLSNPGNISQPEQLYGDGLGLMHYQDSVDADNYYNFDMVYFQKGLLTWGVPFDFSVLDLAVDEINPMGIKLFPNPASNSFSLELKDAGVSEYKIYNSNGICVSTGLVFNDRELIDVQSLPSGIYTLVVSNHITVETIQFVKVQE